MAGAVGPRRGLKRARRACAIPRTVLPKKNESAYRNRRNARFVHCGGFGTHPDLLFYPASQPGPGSTVHESQNGTWHRAAAAGKRGRGTEAGTRCETAAGSGRKGTGPKSRISAREDRRDSGTGLRARSREQGTGCAAGRSQGKPRPHRSRKGTRERAKATWEPRARARMRDRGRIAIVGAGETGSDRTLDRTQRMGPDLGATAPSSRYSTAATRAQDAAPPIGP